MTNSETLNYMNDSVLYILPVSKYSSILNKGISKSRSLSDLEMVLKTSSEDSFVDRRNSFSGALTVNTSLPNVSAAEAFGGPFNMLKEAQVTVSVLNHKTSYSGIPASVNLHQNIGFSREPPKSPTNFNGSKVTTVSTSHSDSQNESNLTRMKLLPLQQTKGHGNHNVCFPVNPNASSKIQSNVYTFGTSSPQISTDHSEVETKSESFLPFDKGNFSINESNPEDSIASPERCKPEVDSSPVKKKSSKRKKENISFVTKVVSLVFFDLETTGLAFEIGKSNVQITEVSMIAINRKEFEESTFEDLRDIRIIQKLCLCTRPRSNISSSAAKVTGLNNENLMDQNPFERDAAEAINFFLSHLPKPVCLLAHNGSNYDFPLLKAEFSRLSMSLPSDILIADTLKAFRVLGVPVFPPEKKICESVKYTKRGHISYSLSNLHLYLFNKKPTGSHSSEGDCIALAKVCHRMKDLILLWVDENCTTFECILPMW